MTDIQTNNRLPLYAAMAAVALLGALGGYLFTRGDAATVDASDRAAVASGNADAAIAASGMSDKDRRATEAVVHAYILEHPEVITEAVEILQRREMVQRLSAAGSGLAKPFYGAEAGNPSGDVTIVEFSDYNCGYCRASVADVQRLLGEDKGIRLIFRELPILSPTSNDAALWALAAAKQGKHKAFHDAMFAGDRPDAQSIRLAAGKAGLDLAAAESFANSAEAKAEVKSNHGMMQQIGFNGTPTFVIGDQILEGALGYDALKAAVAKARSSKS